MLTVTALFAVAMTLSATFALHDTFVAARRDRQAEDAFLAQLEADWDAEEDARHCSGRY